MNQATSTNIKLLLFFWATSFILATGGYYLLSVINSYVFGALIRMYLYHHSHPIPYVAIMCFFYGITATIFARRFSKKKIGGQILFTLLIILLTILFSSPFGGMLWHLHDMQAGYFPDNWLLKMIEQGFSDGFIVGWFIILLSFPYNLLGSIITFFLTRCGVSLFVEEDE